MMIVPMGHDPLAFTLMWSVMTIAMMLPTIMRPLRRIAGNSVNRTFVFLAGYVAVWIVCGIPAYFLMQVQWSLAFIGFGWILVGLYQVMPWTQGALHACQRLRAEDSVWRSGLRQGTACVTACGPLMVIAMLTLMNLHIALNLAAIAMVALTLFMAWEKRPTLPAFVTPLSVVTFVVVGVAMWFNSAPASVHLHL
jgi:predicted metal-binding membrane protein